MLPSDLLFSHQRGGQIYPHFLRPEQRIWSERVLTVIQEHQHRTRGELQAALRALEGDSPDYRIVRGFAHLALNAAEFVLATGELEPEALRQELFTLAAERGRYGETQAQEVLESVAPRYQLETETLREALYADLPENHLLAALPDFTPERLVDRYNLAQAQGLLYSALHLRLTAHRNVPGEYRGPDVVDLAHAAIVLAEPRAEDARVNPGRLVAFRELHHLFAQDVPAPGKPDRPQMFG